jgi:ADP-ribose pyrophosphatase YjhB (NUDIX family)
VTHQITRFNIRVYGLLFNEYNQVLLVNEQINGFRFTKFPGGGLEFGEGISDCLIREFKEETGLDIHGLTHFYTTDFFQTSAFKPNDQIISVYYEVHTNNNWRNIRLDDHEVNNGNRAEFLRFEWVDMEKLNADKFTFSIDKLVCEKLITKEL